MAKVGDLCEIRGESMFGWNVKDIFLLSDEKNIRYSSPTFYFSAASWELWLYPNGETEYKTEGWIGIYLMRMSTGFPVTLDYSIGLKTIEGKSDSSVSSTFCFDKRGFGSGARKLISRIELAGRKSELAPAGELTVICTLKNSEPNILTGSLFNRLKDIGDNLKEIYKKSKLTDFTLKFKDEKIGTHRMILEAQSPVFANMHAHEPRKSKIGEVCIVDTDKKTMDILLTYMYSGDMERLTTQNVLSLYAAAAKYEITGVKMLCVDYVKRNLTVEWVCDVIKFSEMYKEKELFNCAVEFFNGNVHKVVETEKWVTFAKENRNLSIELLKSAVKASVENRDIAVELLGSVVKVLNPETRI